MKADESFRLNLAAMLHFVIANSLNNEDET
jgi:hypothetical protein